MARFRASQHFDQLSKDDAAILLRILDHIHVVDRIFNAALVLQKSGISPNNDRMTDFLGVAGSSLDSR